MTYPEPIEKLIEQLRRLPGVGPKTAERYVFHLLRRPPEETTTLIQQLAHVRDAIGSCATCGTFTEITPCAICKNPRRDRAMLCVVAEASDIIAVERTNEFRGVYHVLGGLLAPIEGIGPEQLRIRELIERVCDTPHPPKPPLPAGGGENNNFSPSHREGERRVLRSLGEGGEGVARSGVTEIIFAFDPTIEGETTVNYLARLLTPTGIRCTRLARGLPVGGDLEYADPITLGDAFTGRRDLPNTAPQRIVRAPQTATDAPSF